jgi:hypothetical protein
MQSNFSKGGSFHVGSVSELERRGLVRGNTTRLPSGSDKPKSFAAPAVSAERKGETHLYDEFNVPSYGGFNADVLSALGESKVTPPKNDDGPPAQKILDQDSLHRFDRNLQQINNAFHNNQMCSYGEKKDKILIKIKDIRTKQYKLFQEHITFDINIEAYTASSGVDDDQPAQTFSEEFQNRFKDQQERLESLKKTIQGLTERIKTVNADCSKNHMPQNPGSLERERDAGSTAAGAEGSAPGPVAASASATSPVAASVGAAVHLSS